MPTKTRIAAATPRISNADIWNAIRSKFPSFASHTSEGTAELFTERGFEALKQTDPTALNDFFGLSIRTYLNLVNISHATDRLADNGFGESFQTPYGGVIQRLATFSIKPISPKYRNLENGKSVDPFIVRKPVTAERFWKQNFDYQSMITIQDDFQMKTIFISEYGMSEYMAGILQGMENGWIIQKYENKLEALNAALNSTKHPLLNTQIFSLDYANPDAPTSDELRKTINTIKKAKSALVMGPQTSAFNPYGFTSVQDESRLKLLVRPGFLADLDTEVLYSAFDGSKLSTEVDIIEVPHFGGLKPTTDGTTPAFPVYDSLGAVTGYSATAGSTSAELEEDSIVWIDPNKDVKAILADKGMIFETIQNNYEVRPINNPAGLYTNYWASAPGNGIYWDPLYNFIVFKTGGAA